MKKFSLLLPALLIMTACGGGRNYLAITGNRCPAKFDIQVIDEQNSDKVVPFDRNQLPVGTYEYVQSQVYYTQNQEENPTLLSVIETAVKSVDQKTQEERVTYSSSTGCVRNIKMGQNLAFSYTLTTDFTIAEPQAFETASDRSILLTTRVANILMSQNTRGAIKPSYTVASNKETSDKLTKYIPEQTILRMYKDSDDTYELRTQTTLTDATIISVVRYRYIPPGE